MYYVLMLGEYEERDVAYVSNDLEKIKRATIWVLENWKYGNRWDTYPSDIVVSDDGFYNHKMRTFMLWQYIDLDKPDIKDVNKLFNEIENYVKEN